MLFKNMPRRASPLSPARGLIAIGLLTLLTGCFPGAADQGQGQGVVVADITEEAEEE